MRLTGSAPGADSRDRRAVATETVVGRDAPAPRGPTGPGHDGGARPKGDGSPFLRPEGEDDDGYDPFSDRPPREEPLFERDPWA